MILSLFNDNELEENRTLFFLVKSQVLSHLATSPYLWIYPFLWIHSPCQIRTDDFPGQSRACLSATPKGLGGNTRIERILMESQSIVLGQYTNFHIRNLPESNRSMNLCREPHLPLCQDFLKLMTGFEPTKKVYKTIMIPFHHTSIVLNNVVALVSVV